jgi:hypothetical protein
MAKTRDGAGDGAEIAYLFGGPSMSFREIGLVVSDAGGGGTAAATAGGGADGIEE